MEQIGKTMEKFSASRTAASSLPGSLDPADKQITPANPDKQLSAGLNTAELIRQQLTQLPIAINPNFEYAVVGYIQHFGWNRVYHWAQKAGDKTHPERWFMSVMKRERYGK